MLRALLKRLGLKQKVDCSNSNIWTSLRTKGEKSVLFAINLLSAPMEAEITCQPGFKNAPVRTGLQHLEPMTVKVMEIA